MSHMKLRPRTYLPLKFRIICKYVLSKLVYRLIGGLSPLSLPGNPSRGHILFSFRLLHLL